MSQISSRQYGSVNTNREQVNVLLTDGSFRLMKWRHGLTLRVKLILIMAEVRIPDVIRFGYNEYSQWKQL